MSAPRRVIVPVNLPCCPDSPRCALCEPKTPPAPATVRALVEHYRGERLHPGDVFRVGFYGGAPPSEALLSAIEGLPFVARVRPDLLSRAQAMVLKERGATAIELDALTFNDLALRRVGRRYRGGLLVEMAEGLRSMGLRVGMVFAPGLPGTVASTALRDAVRAAPLIDFARIHPVLVLRHARLREAHMNGLYVPLTVPQAVTLCAELLDHLEAHDVEVIRVGQNPGADGLGDAVAGPRHSSLRELVESRRVLEYLQGLIAGHRTGAHVVIRCAPEDETRTRGPFNQHIRTLRALGRFVEVEVKIDPALRRGAWRIEENT